MKAGEGSPLCTEYVTTGTMIGIKKNYALGILGSTIGKKKSYNGKRDLGQDRYWSKVRIRHREASSQLAGEIYLQLGLSILLIVVTLEDKVVVTHY